MKKRTRQFIFYGLIVVFAVLSPLIIAYSLGYTFNFSKNSVEKTGGLYIKTSVPFASIFINGTFENETSRFSNDSLSVDMRPTTYLIRIEKEGYQPLSRTLDIREGIVTELRNILLVPQIIVMATSTPNERSLLATSTTPLQRLRIDVKKNLAVVSDAPDKKIIAEQINSFQEFGSTAYAISENGFLLRLDTQTGKIDVVDRPGFYLTKTPARFILSSVGDLAILDASNGLFLLRQSENTITTIGGGVFDIAFDAEGEKMLIRKESTVDMYWIQDRSSQPFEKAGTRETIVALSSLIQDAGWYFGDNEHIIIRTDNGVFVTEVDGRGGRTTHELLGDKTDEIRTLPSRPTSIFVKKKKIWYTIELAS